MSSSKNSGLWLILLVIAAFLIVPKMGLFSTFDSLGGSDAFRASFIAENRTYDFRGTGVNYYNSSSGFWLNGGTSDTGNFAAARTKLESDWKVVTFDFYAFGDLKGGGAGKCSGGAGASFLDVTLVSVGCNDLYVTFKGSPQTKTGRIMLVKNPSGSVDLTLKECESCPEQLLKTISDLNEITFFGSGDTSSDNTQGNGFAKYQLQIHNLRVSNTSEVESLRGQITALEQNIAFLNSTLEQKAATMKGLQLTLDEYSEVINKLQLEVDEKAGLMRELELTVEEYSEVIRKLELRVADEAAIANQLEIDLAQMVNLTNGLQLRLDEQLIFLNNLNLNLAAKEALVRQLRITNVEQEALLAQMRGSFAEQAAILDGLNLTLQDDARQINGLELSLQAQGGIIDALRLNLSDMQELISFLKLSNAEKLELITSLNLTIQEQQRLLDALKLTPVLEVERLCESTGGVWSSSKGCDCIPVPDQSGTPIFVAGEGCKVLTDAGGSPIFGGVDNKLLLWIGGIIGGLILLRRLL